MKILQINASYKPAYVYGGPTMSVAALCEALVNAGQSVEVYTTTANGKADLPVANSPVNVDGVPVQYFKRITGDHSHLSPALLRHLWKNVKQFDVVHIHAWWNLVSVFAALVAAWHKVPLVISPRGTLSSYTFQHKNGLFKSLLHNLLGKKLLNNSRIHVTSDYEAQAIGKLLSPVSIINIPNFVKYPDQVPPHQKADTGVLNLLFLSRIDAKKGIDNLLQALPLMQPPFHLTIAGNAEADYLQQLKQLSQTLGIADKITWAGFKHDDKFDLIARHDVLALPSHDENFANVVIESLSVGTAVLVSKNVGLSAYVQQHHLGWVCETSPQSIAQKLNAIAGNREKIQLIAETAPAKIRNDFNEVTLTQTYLNLYQQAAHQ